MNASVTINGVQFATWAKEDGITVSPIYRREKKVIALSGLEYRSQRTKYQIEIQTVTMNESTIQSLLSALSTNPATVIENVVVPGTSHTRTCYIDNPKFSAHKVVGNNTDFSSFTLTLTEM